MNAKKEKIKPIHIPEFHNYTFVKELPTGTLSSTSLLIHKQNHLNYICKSFPKNVIASPEQINLLMERSNHLKSLNFVCPYVDIYQTEDSVYLIRPYLDVLNLSDFLLLHRLDQNSIYELWRSIVKRYYLIHKANVFPNSIKPSNIFITRDKQIILTDFYIFSPGINFVFQTPNPLDIQWFPPEYFTGTAKVNASSDIWSLAALFITMNGIPLPWVSKNIFTMIEGKINPRLDCLTSFHFNISKIIISSLQCDQSKRPSLKQILLEPKLKHKTNKFGGFNSYHKLSSTAVTSSQRKVMTLNPNTNSKMCFRYRKLGGIELDKLLLRNSQTVRAPFYLKQTFSEPYLQNPKSSESQ